MLLSILFLSIAINIYYQCLVVKGKRLLAKGNCWDDWNKVEQLRKSLLPWTGFLRFADPIVIVLIAQDMSNASYPWPVWVGAAVWGFICSYWQLFAWFGWMYKALFVKSANSQHDRKWLVYVANRRLVREFGTEYPRTHAFLRLAARLFICNTIGHRWTRWEMIKYGNFGDSRTCKACMIHETKEKGVHTFCETHGRSWRGIANPNSVFRRKYVRPE